MAEAPVQLLEKLVSQSVVLHLKDGRTVEGRLAGCDEHLNLVVDGAGERSADVTRHLGRVVLRGSSVVTVHLPGANAPGGR